MKLEKVFLRSKLGRRIFFLFISCALIPIIALAIFSFTQVTRQLWGQSQERLRKTVKDTEMSIRERLNLIRDDMQIIASNWMAISRDFSTEKPMEFSASQKEHFKCIGIIDDSGQYMSFFDCSQDIPEITPAERDHLLSGKIFISAKYNQNNSSSVLKSSPVYMSMSLDSAHKRQEILLAEIDPTYLWYAGLKDSLPPMTHLCILDESNNLLESSIINLASFPEQDAAKLRAGHSGGLEWRYDKEEYVASYRLLDLEDPYIAPGLTLVMSTPKSYVLQPIILFRRVFPFIILMSLWVVILLSFSQIRRNLVPLERLKAGTERIARREFDSRVTVESNDEFEDLAESFNTMADQLGRQFKALVTMGELDRAILSALDTKRIADTAITRMNDVVSCDAVSATLLNSKDSYKAESYLWEEKPHKRRTVDTVQFDLEDIRALEANTESFFVEPTRTPPRHLEPMVKRGIKSFLVMPIFLKKSLAGTITLGYLNPPIISQEDVDQARRLVNQVAVAISNARLIEELHDLNWGALTALARAIDAKSPWTAGHSERVTKLALKIGRSMKLPKRELDNLHRGGLLHDLGKIGIPPEILDKPGKLTAEEMRLMHKHVEFGVRILKPIAAYAEAIPIVEQHHERFDGSGYPNGLAGEDISLGGHIYALADDFDAFATDRPYRKALPLKRIINLIKGRSGSKYHPKVVEAFLEVMEQEDREEKQQ
jgi:putative nucleotidyltransferase with HDIG domain